MPVLIGSKKAGVLQTILGAVLVAVSIWMPGIGIAASNLMFAAGAAMAIGGVTQMLSPQAKGLASKQDADNKASYAFGGVTNTTSQAYPLFRQFIVGWDQEDTLTDKVLMGFLYAYPGTDEAMFSTWCKYMQDWLVNSQKQLKPMNIMIN